MHLSAGLVFFTNETTKIYIKYLICVCFISLLIIQEELQEYVLNNYFNTHIGGKTHFEKTFVGAQNIYLHSHFHEIKFL